MSEIVLTPSDREQRTFSYTAVSSTGKRTTAKMTANSSQEVSEALAADGWFPVKITAVQDGALNKDISEIFGEKPLKFKIRELADFASKFHQLLKAGVPVSRALKALGEEEEPKRHAMCEDLAMQVNNGVPLSEAFALYPKVFDKVFVAYIKAGEITGTLVPTTQRLSSMLDRRSKMLLKIKSVTTYPKLVSGVIVLMVVGIMIFLVPTYSEIYESFDAELPAATQILVDISNEMMPITFTRGSSFPFIEAVHFHPLSPMFWAAIIAAVSFIYLKKTKDNPKVGIMLDKMRYKMPIFGGLNKRNNLFRWASTVSGGLSSGVTLPAALQLAAETSGSRWQMAIVEDMKDSIRSGRTLSQTLDDYADLFPPNIRTMVAVGETSGDLSAMLDSVASTIDSEVDALIAGLAAKIEVALLLAMGVVVGGLLMVLYLPIINLATTVGGGMSDGAF